MMPYHKVWRGFMTSVIFWYGLKYTLLLPLYGWVVMRGLISTGESLHIQFKNVNKKRLWLLSTIFLISLTILSWMAYIDSPLDGLVFQVVFGGLVGALWSWMFLEFVKALGYTYLQPKKTQLWCVFSVGIFVLYPYLK